MTSRRRVPAPRSRSKYGNVKTVIDGITFYSKKEARRYQELLLLQKAGEIRHLELQPRFKLVVNGFTVGTYVGDFRYTEGNRGTVPVVEDSKGLKLPLYVLKRKLMFALFRIVIRET